MWQAEKEGVYTMEKYQEISKLAIQNTGVW